MDWLTKAHAQPRNLAFTHLTVESGLSHNTVFDVIQDREGYLWVATEEGLNRYNGYDFEVFTYDLSDSTSLADNWVSSVFEDSKGNIWVSTDSGVNRFIPQTRNFKRFLDEGFEVWSVAEDQEGQLWIATSNGLYEIDIAADSLVGGPYRMAGTGSQFIVRTVVVGPDNHIWIGTREYGLLHFNRDTNTFSEVPGVPYCVDSPCDYNNTVYHILFDDGKILVGTQSGLFVREYSGHEWRYYGGEESRLIDFPLEGIVDIVPSGFSGYWIGTRSFGLIHLDINTNAYTQYLHDDSKSNSLVANEVRSIFRDRYGVLWFGAGALSKVDLQIGTMELIQFNPRNTNSLSDNAVNAILEDNNPDIIWIGTKAGGLNRLNKKTNQFTHYYQNSNATSRLSIDYVESLYQDKEGAVWIGTRDGLNRFNPENESIEHFFSLQADHPSNWIRVIHPSAKKEDVLWLSRGSEGLHRFDIKTGRLTAVDVDMKMWISAIYEDPSGKVWLGTEGNGLVKYKPDQGKFISYKYSPDDPYSLRSTDVYVLHASSDSVLWLGTAQGLVHFNTQEDKFTHYTTRNSALPHNTVYGILEDDRGRLWISTLNGFSLLDPSTMEFSSLDDRLGLQGRAFNKYAYHQGASGMMYFGGLNGFNYFEPEAIKANPVAPELRFTDLKLFDQSIGELPGSSGLVRKLNTDSVLVFNAQQNDLTVEFVGLHYSNPQQLEYTYRINRENQDWRNIEDQRSVNINGLTPGEYTFEVKTINADAIESVESDVNTLRFKITPPWWRTSWAYVLYVLIIGLSGYAVSRYQKNRLIRVERARAEEERKELELQKARQLQMAYDALQASMEELKRTQEQLVQAEKMASLGQLTAGIAHEIKNPLNFINNFADLQTDYLNDLKMHLKGQESEQLESILTVIQENAGHIHKHGLRADRIVQTMMQHVRGTSGNRELSNINDILSHAIVSALGGFNKKGVLENVVVDKNLDPELPLVSVVSSELGRVFINLLTNAFAAVLEKAELNQDFIPRVRVETSQLPEKVVISIEDNGPGIPVEHHQKIFDPFFTTRKSGDGNIGLGLSLSFDIIVRGHQGSIKIDNGDLGGAVFVIDLPIVS